MKSRIIVIAATVAVSAILITIYFTYGNLTNANNFTQIASPENMNSANQGGTKIDLSLFSAKATALLGSPSATITIVEFGDYQCFHCNKFFHNTESGIEKNYVETGKVKMIFKDFTIIGQDSISAAHASHCANEQGKFWEYHDALYNHWTGENTGWASLENLNTIAQGLGLDASQFNDCMTSGKYSSVIKENNSDGKALGVSGTPTFFIIGHNSEVRKVIGSQPYEVFQEIFDSESIT